MAVWWDLLLPSSRQRPWNVQSLDPSIQRLANDWGPPMGISKGVWSSGRKMQGFDPTALALRLFSASSAPAVRACQRWAVLVLGEEAVSTFSQDAFVRA